MDIPSSFLERAALWPSLKRWERHELAQDLRRLGLSYREIGAVIPATKGSLSAWCRDVMLSPDQHARLASTRPAAETRIRVGARRRAEAIARRNRIRRLAREKAAQFHRDPLWAAGVAAYWAEGSKKQDIRFANSDPGLVRLFIRWSVAYLEAEPGSFTAKLNIHSGQDDEACKREWSALTGIPVGSFTRSYIKPEGTGHRKNTLYLGTMTVRLRNSGDRLQTVLGWIESMSAGCGGGAISSAAATGR